ncbi:ANL, N-terminal domain [Fusarium oxysporum f. sp. vasinfectum]|nr:ANL, N-terminal domain [Fusarium oxysporum f. sp. vasinfectum]
MNPPAKTALWSPQNLNETNAVKFINHVNEKYGLRLQTYEDLYKWSVGDETINHFWTQAYAWLKISSSGTDDLTGEVACFNPSDSLSNLMFPPPKFFPAATLNIAELIFRGRKDTDIAIYFSRESLSDVEKVTWASLRERVRKLRSALVNSGVVAGDVVAAVISNSVDAIVICLAALSVGALWSSTSCDMGVGGIVDRYSQIRPKIIFADQGYVYAGKIIDLSDRIRQWSSELREQSDMLAHVVVIPNPNLNSIPLHQPNTYILENFLKADRGDQLLFEIIPFSHPAFILFSSGTTGPPKCIVHSTGGVALKTKVDSVIQHDIRKTDIVFQYTTTSWIMWVLNLMNLSCGAAMLLYDGSPFHPRPSILLELAQAFKVSVFGASPRYLSTLKGLGITPRRDFDLSRLRIMLSTGSVLSAELYEWFYSIAFPPSAQLISMSGGTDIAGCFVCGTPMLPVYAGEIQCKALGMAVDIYDSGTDEHVSVEEHGAPGELVCAKPFPSQPLAFLGKDGYKQYKASYFERYGPSVWCQGDFVQRSPATGGIFMLGRSDGVLNPSGVRFGSAEIYAVIETIPEVLDSICVGQKREVDINERVLLFVKIRPGASLTSHLKSHINSAIRDQYSPRHVPAYIFEVDDIPYTANGKKCEINVKHAINGNKFAVAGSVANPAALKVYEKLADTGLINIEATSFVSPKWVPQLADGAEVMKEILARPGHVYQSRQMNYPVLAPNLKGLENASQAGAKEIVVFASVTEAFSKANQNCTVEEALQQCEAVTKKALSLGIRVRGVISCMFSDPFSGPTSPSAVLPVVKRLLEMGCYEVGLGDTLGVGTPKKVQDVLDKLLAEISPNRLAGHFHDTYGQGIANIVRAYEMGLRKFDSSVAGLGGCPYAPGARGNVATEDVIYTLENSGISTGVDLNKLCNVGQWISKEIGIPYGSRAGAALVAKRSNTISSSGTPKPTPPKQHRSWKVVEDTGEYRVSRSGTSLKVTLTRPKNGNALTDSMLEGLTALFKKLPRDPYVYHLVIESEGKFFCTGMDLSGNTDTANGSDDGSYYAKVAALYEALDHVPQTTIAVVDGPCFGGGVGLAFTCDVRLVSPKARWTLSEIKIGVSPAVISKYLVREWGASIAREGMLSGREIRPEELARVGAVHGISSDEASLTTLLDNYLDQLDKCAPRSAAINKELTRMAWLSPDSEKQTSLVKRTFANMMVPGSEGEHGIRQFQKKVKSFSWKDFWGNKSPLEKSIY